MKKAAVAGGALWVLPTISSFNSPAAANSPAACLATSALGLTVTPVVPPAVPPAAWTLAAQPLTCNAAGVVTPNVADAVILSETTGTGAGETVNMIRALDGGTTLNGSQSNGRSLPVVGLCSYYIWRNTGGPVLQFIGTITPPTGWRIEAVAWNTTVGAGGIFNTTPQWRRPAGLTYDPAAIERPLNGPSIPTAVDYVTLAPGGSSVTVNLLTSSGCDAVRVFLEHAPPA